MTAPAAAGSGAPLAPVQPIRPAATIILVRQANSQYQIFMLKRTSRAAFASGMYVFPGGRVDGDDHLHRFDAVRRGPSDAQAHQQRALGNDWRGYWLAGIRESFEEAGLLLAYRGDELLAFADAAERARFAGYREPLYRGAMDLRDICESEGLTLAVDRIHFWNRIVTPLGRPRRFDTRFFIAEAPSGQTGEHDDHETVDSTWISPREALERNDAQEFDLMRVTRQQLQLLDRFNDQAAVLDMVRANRDFPVRRPVLPPGA